MLHNNAVLLEIVDKICSNIKDISNIIENIETEIYKIQIKTLTT